MSLDAQARVSRETIGERIKRLRSLLIGPSGGVLRQEDVAEAVGVSRGAVSAWESGRSRPRGGALEKLAEVLDTTPDYIWEGDEEPELVGKVKGLIDLWERDLESLRRYNVDGADTLERATNQLREAVAEYEAAMAGDAAEVATESVEEAAAAEARTQEERSG